MSKDDKRARDSAHTTHAADAAQREDPMTSFDPEGGRGAPAGESADGAAPAERKPRGNGSADAGAAPGQPATPGATAAGAAAAPQTPPAAGEQPAAAGSETTTGAEPGQPGAAEQEQPSELELARAEAAQHFDRYVRLQAEFDNYKKRIGKEHGDSLRYALTPLVAEVAAIMDNLERAVEHARKDPGDGVAALLAGIEMVLKQMSEALGRFGVLRIEAVGQPFDPGRHEAINVVESDDVPENQVLEEYQAGYLLHDRVIRPARVCVSKRSGNAGGQPPPPGD
jgi:molecular chaperone GrpE